MTDIYEGMPFTETAKQAFEKSYPQGTVSFTRGTKAPLEEKDLYLVRGGAHAVIMPRMKYSGSVEEALEHLSDEK